MHDLDAQRGAACGQFPACDLIGRQQGALATHQADQGRAGALEDTEGGQFGIQAGPFPPAPLAGAGQRTTVPSGEIKDESPEQPKGKRARLRLAERLGGLGHFFLAASARGCCCAAWASKLATSWSASWPKARWIWGSRAAKAAGSRASCSAQRACWAAKCA